MQIQKSTKVSFLSGKDVFSAIYIAPVLTALLFFLFFVTGCNKKPEYLPGSSVQGIRAPISKVLFSPIAYDGAVLKLEGIVTDVTESEGSSDRDNSDGVSSEDTASGKAGENEENTGDDTTTIFKLRDLNGNYVNIILPGSWEIFDDDYMIVGGTYRKNGNELEARQFEMMDFEKGDKEKEIEKRDEW